MRKLKMLLLGLGVSLFSFNAQAALEAAEQAVKAGIRVVAQLSKGYTPPRFVQTITPTLMGENLIPKGYRPTADSGGTFFVKNDKK